MCTLYTSSNWNKRSSTRFAFIWGSKSWIIIFCRFTRSTHFLLRPFPFEVRVFTQQHLAWLGRCTQSSSLVSHAELSLATSFLIGLFSYMRRLSSLNTESGKTLSSPNMTCRHKHQCSGDAAAEMMAVSQISLQASVCCSHTESSIESYIRWNPLVVWCYGKIFSNELSRYDEAEIMYSSYIAAYMLYINCSSIYIYITFYGTSCYPLHYSSYKQSYPQYLITFYAFLKTVVVDQWCKRLKLHLY